jgi:hypothetical protein
MPLTVLAGTASNVSLGSDITYAASAQHGPIPIKNQLVSLRIDNKPILFRSRTLPSVSDNDQVAAAGPLKNGTLEALALRNLTTGAVYHPPTTMVLILSAILIVAGIPLIAFLGIGLFFVGMGVYMVLRALKIRKAVALLQTQSAPAAAHS